jgi:hypothetical protein
MLGYIVVDKNFKIVEPKENTISTTHDYPLEILVTSHHYKTKAERPEDWTASHEDLFGIYLELPNILEYNHSNLKELKVLRVEARSHVKTVGDLLFFESIYPLSEVSYLFDYGPEHPVTVAMGETQNSYTYLKTNFPENDYVIPVIMRGHKEDIEYLIKEFGNIKRPKLDKLITTYGSDEIQLEFPAKNYKEKKYRLAKYGSDQDRDELLKDYAQLEDRTVERVIKYGNDEQRWTLAKKTTSPKIQELVCQYGSQELRDRYIQNFKKIYDEKEMQIIREKPKSGGWPDDAIASVGILWAIQYSNPESYQHLLGHEDWEIDNTIAQYGSEKLRLELCDIEKNHKTIIRTLIKYGKYDTLYKLQGQCGTDNYLYRDIINRNNKTINQKYAEKFNPQVFNWLIESKSDYMFLIETMVQTLVKTYKNAKTDVNFYNSKDKADKLSQFYDILGKILKLSITNVEYSCYLRNSFTELFDFAKNKDENLIKLILNSANTSVITMLTPYLSSQQQINTLKQFPTNKNLVLHMLINSKNTHVNELAAQCVPEKDMEYQFYCEDTTEHERKVYLKRATYGLKEQFQRDIHKFN